MFRKVLVANRGVVACRVIRTLRRLGIGSVAVYSEADRHAPHVAAADTAICIGKSAAAETYLRGDLVLKAALETGAEAIHPGYGFLSENADFAQSCLDGGLAFIGPTPAQIRMFGLKHQARKIAAEAGVPLAPGSALLADLHDARQAAAAIGYPVMLKSTAGGGGIGLVLCRDEAALDAAYERTARLAVASFGDGGLFVERAIARGRHVEVQIFGDGRGGVTVLGDRDCSAQRRHQKVIEETPAPFLPETLRQELHAAAARLGEAVHYANAGTVEFIYDTAAGKAYFLEVNTRLQVEHAVTEAMLGIDLVEWMLCQAAGDAIPSFAPPAPRHAIEARLYAEDPGQGFQPASGRLTRIVFPDGVRVDAGIAPGTDVSPFYDPMLATVIAVADDRAAALQALADALGNTVLEGLETNLSYLRHLLACGALAGEITTATLAETAWHPDRVMVVSAGTQTIIQDFPGRLGFWHVGVPPSGPMDDLSFRLGNRAVGNAAGAAGLEIIVSGPALRFDCEAVICLAGAALPATLDGVPVPYWEPVAVPRGAELAIGTGSPAGCRTYLALRGGFDVPVYLGSRSTFTLGHFGGQHGRALVAGDVLRPGDGAAFEPAAIPLTERPEIGTEWVIGVLDGPHGAPDFFTDADIAAFHAARWVVHYNSSRTGVRLIGPKPGWARSDGGEAGLHPSNIHDTAYAVGAVDFTGDMPVILGPDGPSLGGFVCPVTIAKAELWKAGQLRAGDGVRFRRIDERPLMLGGRAATATTPHVAYRRSGESNVLVEYGAQVLDLELRFRVHVLMQAVAALKLPGIIDLTPGIRSLQVQFDPAILDLGDLLAALAEIESELPANDDIVVPSRIVHLPLSWDDPGTRDAIRRYMRSVRPDAPWCPSNIEFIRRINGLADEAEVRRIVLSADYLVLGLGDVYLGAPVATPLDPRHRLVTTKYNPARTWTPENAVGIGGAYLCVYGMEGPGGYQFVGRTCQVWNSLAETPWLLRFFDRIRFFEVGADELLRFRDDFPHGKAGLRITEDEFRLRDYRDFLAANANGIAAFKARQQAAFEAERARWAAAGTAMEEMPPPIAEDDTFLAAGHEAVTSPVAGGIWKILVALGEAVVAGQILVILESMKAEISVPASRAGTVAAIRASEGQVVAMGQRLVELA